ncbi:MAG: Transcription elongation factor GreA [Candidatus Curtissbacteria bacterium GW2011_GWA1_41_11]|uniref:Transcription elongation factor GreA n=1 Tax=Candidatus Curtissbacteria bacterium GW2011_GWA1_41_11 TaxID=1618409 RepID=A0A0G0UGZ2_9BACT|nr:MAG: Transcription elongation factor GreA [Candidatus Curtissbacteria bacterium GW2011_GWA1_41_11]
MNHKVQTKNNSNSTIKIGIPFTYKDSSGKNYTFTIVSEKDSDINQNKISAYSALGKAILGKSIGEKTKIEAPGGKYEVKILKILNRYG